jgi:hypothetical protein
LAFSWIVYTTLAPRDALVVEEKLREGIDALLKARPGLARKGGEWGDVTVEEAVPSADDVAELADAYDREVSEEVLDRLDVCKSAFSVERAGVRDIDPLQVSILRFLLDQCGPCLVDWGDMQIVLSEDVEAELSSYASAGDLRHPPAPEAAPAAKPEAAAPASEAGLERSTATENAMEAIASDPFLDKRFKRALAAFPDFVRAYVDRVGSKGALGDAAAAKELGVTLEKLEPQLKKLHETATGLAAEAEDDEDDG